MLARRVFSILIAIIAALAPLGETGAQTGTQTREPAALAAPRDAGILAALRARGEMRVCIWPDYFAITFRNPRNNELEGLDIDMARALALRLSVRVQFVETTFAAFADRLEDRSCDVAMMGVGITAERATRLAFARPYLASPAFAVTTRGNRRIRGWADIDTAGTVVAVTAGTVQEGLMRRTLLRAELMVVHAPRTREAELLSGRADVFISDFAFTRRLAIASDWATVLEPPDRFGETLYAWAALPSDTPWIGELNNFLNTSQADGTLARAAARHGLAGVLIR